MTRANCRELLLWGTAAAGFANIDLAGTQERPGDPACRMFKIGKSCCDALKSALRKLRPHPGGEAYAACAVSLVFPGRPRFGRRCSSSQPLQASVTVRGTGRAPVRYWLTVRRVSPMAVAASVRESR